MCSKRFFECAREFGAAWHENGFSTVRKISRQVVAMGKPVDLSRRVYSSLASRKIDWYMLQHLGIHAIEVYV